MILILLLEQCVVHLLIVRHVEQNHIEQLAVKTRVSLGLFKNLAQLKQKVLADTLLLISANIAADFVGCRDLHSVVSLLHGVLNIHGLHVGRGLILHLKEYLERCSVDHWVAPLWCFGEISHLVSPSCFEQCL